MANNNNNNSGYGIVGLIVVVAVIALLGSCSSDSSDDYRKTLESGQSKYNSGSAMSKEEYEAVKGFNEWKSNQGEKKYSDWDD